MEENPVKPSGPICVQPHLPGAKTWRPATFFAAGDAKNPAISAAGLRARLQLQWSLRFCDASFVPLPFIQMALQTEKLISDLILLSMQIQRQTNIIFEINFLYSFFVA